VLKSVISERQPYPVNHFALLSSAQLSDPLVQSHLVYSHDLSDVDDAGTRKIRFSGGQTHVPGHLRKPEIGSDCRDNYRVESRVIVAIVLNDNRWALTRWLRAFTLKM
jgi:hypothetical protein